MLTAASFWALCFLGVFGMLGVIQIEVNIWKNYDTYAPANPDKYYKEIRDKALTGQTNQDHQSSFFSVCIRIAGFLAMFAAPVYAVWSLSSGVGNIVLAVICIVASILSWWKPVWALFQVGSKFKSGFGRYQQDGNMYQMMDEIFEPILSAMPKQPAYAWTEVLKRLIRYLPDIYLLYLLIVVVRM